MKSLFPSPRKSKITPPKMIYVFRCPMCNKKFNRVSSTPQFGQHKDRDGLPCGGTPLFETTEYK